MLGWLHGLVLDSRFSLFGSLRLPCVLLLILVTGISAAGQRRRPLTSPGTNRLDVPQPSAQRQKDPSGPPINENCFLWSAGGQVAVIGVSELKAPDSAHSEVRAACSDLQRKHLSRAENHFRKALEIYPAYISVYVMLGETLEAEKQPEQAREQYEKAISADSKYLLPLLCLTDMEARTSHWSNVLQLSRRAVDMDPANFNGYFYNGLAEFGLEHPAEAEKQAIRASDLDVEHRDPRIQLLLAEIFERMGDRTSAAAQLNTYLQVNKSQKNSAMVKAHLEQLERQTHP